MQVSIASQYKNSLLTELTQAKDLLNRLESHIENQSVTAFCATLISAIRSSLENSIRMAHSLNLEADKHRRPLMCPGTGMTDSPNSVSSGTPFEDHSTKEMGKKRKTQPKWTTQVRLGVGVGAVEGPVDDGYSWRKYGQKDILGAKYPRGYYRCTHRNTQGCSATKQVQRSDTDPQVFDITYHGTHTCLGRNSSGRTQKEEVVSFGAGLQVKTEGLSYDVGRDSLSFVFGSGPAVGITSEFFSPPSTPDNSLVRSCPSFVSPATSESTYFPLSPCRVGSDEMGHKLQTSGSDIADIMSAHNSTVLGDFMLDLDTSFSFDQFDSSFFS